MPTTLEGSNVTLLPTADGTAPQLAPLGRADGAPRQRRGQPERRLASEDELLARLTLLGQLAPAGPLSLIAITIHGLAELEPHDWRTPAHVVDAVGRQALGLVRATDLLGRLSNASYGLVLQGAAGARAAAMADELTELLRELPVGQAPIEIVVSAVTGTGVNADLLPRAAVESLLPAS